MGDISPLGKMVSQAGTLSGNPLAMTAGYETLVRLRRPGVYDILEAKAAALEAGFRENLKSLKLNLQINRVGSMMTLFFTDEPVTCYRAATRCDQERFARYFRAMLKRGIYLAPSQFEAVFVSLAHEDADIQETVKAHYGALKMCMA
jgi:glutamate-1-semialdehyde 2,1-aminomutase